MLVDSRHLTAAAIKEQARTLGFDLAGVAPAAALPELDRLATWLERGYAGEMTYLHRSAETRRDIRHFLPSARSVIVTGTVYYTEPTDKRPDSTGGRAQIARYAWGEDYHVVLAERLEALVAWMREQHASPFEARVFVDKHHVQERAFARHAGLGWIGKNTCLINPEIGSWLFLSGVAVSLDLECDAAVADHCGACTLCIDACPTGAILEDSALDATRCISYLTIEHKGPIPEERRAGIGDHVFGCDVCQEVCPYNLAPLATLDPAWQPRAGRDDVTAADLWARSDFDLHRMVADSAMTRVTVARLRRNVAVALGNSGEAAAAEILDRPGGGVPGARRSRPTRRSCASTSVGPGRFSDDSVRSGLWPPTIPLLHLCCWYRCRRCWTPTSRGRWFCWPSTCTHGAFGLVVNRRMSEPAHEVIKADPPLEVRKDVYLFVGGPVEPNRAWVLTRHRELDGDALEITGGGVSCLPHPGSFATRWRRRPIRRYASSSATPGGDLDNSTRNSPLRHG